MFLNIFCSWGSTLSLLSNAISNPEGTFDKLISFFILAIISAIVGLIIAIIAYYKKNEDKEEATIIFYFSSVGIFIIGAIIKAIA